MTDKISRDAAGSPQASVLPFTDYALYSYVPGSRKWSYHGRAATAAMAMKKADILMRSGLYARVEIKRRSFDRRTGAFKEKIWKIQDRERRGFCLRRLLSR